MIDFAALISVAAFGAAFLAVGLGLRLISRWSPRSSLFDAFGGYRDPPWPRGVQEEEPVRWRIEALRRPGRARPQGQGPGATLDAGASASLGASRPTTWVSAPHGKPRDSPAPYPPASAAC